MNRAAKVIRKACLPVLALAVFLGAMGWAKSRDPFRRIWFTVPVAGGHSVNAVVVMPKAARAYPVVVYVHGTGGSTDLSGNDLRQLAEVGLAAVGLDYDQENPVNFDRQFSALADYLQLQPWAMTNAVAWAGWSLGAQNLLRFTLAHPEMCPQLLFQLSGGWVLELNQASMAPSAHRAIFQKSRFLLVQGEADEVFPVEETHRLAELLRTNGIPVTEKIVPGRGHNFAPDRALVIRLAGEYCRAALTPQDPFRGTAELRPHPFWVWLTPAIGWLALCLIFWKKTGQPETADAMAKLTGWDKALRGLALALALLAATVTGFHMAIPHLAVSGRTLELARRWLVPPKALADFNLAATNAVWQGKPLKILLDNVELAGYNRNDLINWKVDDNIYQDYVLSPRIDLSMAEEVDWRRPLWESFYPRIRKEKTPEAAAEIVARHLRERVTVAPDFHPDWGVKTMWERGVADEKGFDRVYVAALRSVGIGARINQRGRAEYWNRSEWQAAPRPLVSSFLR